jgi:hypothetical protein
MRLRVLVGGLGLGQLAGFGVDIVVALAGAVDAVGPVQAGVEPLREFGARAGWPACSQLVDRRRGRLLRIESSRPSSPSRSRCRRAGRTPGGHRFGAVALVLGQLGERLLHRRTERHSQDGTEFSSTFFSRAGTPALRKYFCARCRRHLAWAGTDSVSAVSLTTPRYGV